MCKYVADRAVLIEHSTRSHKSLRLHTSSMCYNMKGMPSSQTRETADHTELPITLSIGCLFEKEFVCVCVCVCVSVSLLVNV